MRKSQLFILALLPILAFGVAAPDVCHGQGAIVSAGGPVHRGMGGALRRCADSAISRWTGIATGSAAGALEVELGLDFSSYHQSASLHRSHLMLV